VLARFPAARPELAGHIARLDADPIGGPARGK
jgi:hypothetical protein